MCTLYTLPISLFSDFNLYNKNIKINYRRLYFSTTKIRDIIFSGKLNQKWQVNALTGNWVFIRHYFIKTKTYSLLKKDDNHCCALHYIALSGNFQALTQCIKAAKLSWEEALTLEDNQRMTLLHYLALSGNFQALQQCLKAANLSIIKANRNFSSWRGSILSYLGESGSLHAIQQFRKAAQKDIRWGKIRLQWFIFLYTSISHRLARRAYLTHIIAFSGNFATLQQCIKAAKLSWKEVLTSKDTGKRNILYYFARNGNFHALQRCIKQANLSWEEVRKMCFGNYWKESILDLFAMSGNFYALQQYIKVSGLTWEEALNKDILLTVAESGSIYALKQTLKATNLTWKEALQLERKTKKTQFGNTSFLKHLTRSQNFSAIHECQKETKLSWKKFLHLKDPYGKNLIQNIIVHRDVHTLKHILKAAKLSSKVLNKHKMTVLNPMGTNGDYLLLIKFWMKHANLSLEEFIHAKIGPYKDLKKVVESIPHPRLVYTWEKILGLHDNLGNSLLDYLEIKEKFQALERLIVSENLTWKKILTLRDGHDVSIPQYLASRGHLRALQRCITKLSWKQLKNLKDRMGRSILHILASRGHLQALKKCIRYYNLSSKQVKAHKTNRNHKLIDLLPTNKHKQMFEKFLEKL